MRLRRQIAGKHLRTAEVGRTAATRRPSKNQHNSSGASLSRIVLRMASAGGRAWREGSRGLPAHSQRATSLTSDPSHPGRKRRAGPEDVEIGRKIRALRLQRGLSQSGLAEGIDLTFQQVQKYEKGANRVSAGRLQRIADLLNVPITFFYGGMGAKAKKKDQRDSSLVLLQSKGAMRLLRAYAGIGSRTTKYALVTLAESLKNKEKG